MYDRIPTPGLEGLVKITKLDGTSFLAFLEMADNPSNLGTPISKATLLKDATAAMFGFGADAVPDDVFAEIKTLIDFTTALANKKAEIELLSWVGTGTLGKDNPTILTFRSTPKVVYLIEASDVTTVARYASKDYRIIWGKSTYMTPSSGIGMPISYSGNTMSWYYDNAIPDNANVQLNKAGATYYALALC